MTDHLLLPAAAAKFLAISVKTLRGHVQDGSIRFIQTGRGLKRPGIAFAPSDLAEFIDKRRMQAASRKGTACVSVRKRQEPIFDFSARLEQLQIEKLRDAIATKKTHLARAKNDLRNLDADRSGQVLAVPIVALHAGGRDTSAFKPQS